jgi:peptidoglycan hydrolase FlgJ
VADIGAVSGILNMQTPQVKDTPDRARQAGQQFEALLLSQMMRTMRESGSNWLGGGSGGANDTATEYAETQFAQALAASGGLGIATMVTKGLADKT